MRDPMKPTSIRALARKLGVSHQAVSAAVKRGRIERSVAYIKGRPVIVNVPLALQEWERNRDPLMDPNFWR